MQDSEITVDSEQELFNTISMLRTPDECRQFFRDLCTPSEIRSFADRWLVAKTVDKGIPYRKVQEITGVSTATITRVARHLSHGSGGYRSMLQRQSRGKK